MSENNYYSDQSKITDKKEALDSGEQKNVAIMVIDVGLTMFDDTKCFKKCLLAAYHIFDRMFFESYRNNISICLLRDDEIVLTAINDNPIKSEKKLLELLKKPIDALKNEFVRDRPASLKYTLIECMKQFSTLDSVNPFIVLLTDDDDPHKGDKNENIIATNVALALSKANIKFIVVPLIEKFSYDVFYEIMIKTANVSFNLSEYKNYKACTAVEQLIYIIESILGDKVSLRRHTFRLFDEGEKLIQFRIQIRYLVDDNNLNYNANVSSTTQNEVKKQYENQDNVDLDNLFYELDDKRIKFDKSDYLYLDMPYGFKLLWISKNKISSFHYKKNQAFIMQKDQQTPDSVKQNLFDYVWNYCYEKNRYMLCGFHVPGRNHYPKLVELTPSIFESTPCFAGEFLSDKLEIENDTNLAFDDETNETEFEEDDPEFGLICDMIYKLHKKIYNPFQYIDEEYEKTASILKTKFFGVDEEPVKNCFPTDAEITVQLGATGVELQEMFGEKVESSAAKKWKKK